jgi:uncharacterized membrane protein YkoI
MAMKLNKWWIIPAAFGVVALVSGAAVAASSATDDDESLRGDQRDRAVAAALEFTGGGEAIEAEAGDGGAAYEVEIRGEDGTVTEVELDSSFTVMGDTTDDDGGESADDDD